MTRTERADIPEDQVLAGLRGECSLAEIAAVVGADREDVLAACRATLAERVPPANIDLRAAVTGPVEILRDNAGVPHVYAGTTADLYYGLGFAMAEDRLWQMDRLRRRALGRQAEILGEAYVKSDLTHLLVGIDKLAAAEVEPTDPATQGLLDAFVAGINRQIEVRGTRLPIEFALLDYEPAPFTVRDVIAILRGIWWSLNGRLESIVAVEVANLLPRDDWRTIFLTPEAQDETIVPADAPYPPPDLTLKAVQPVVAGAGDGIGSNNWAVAASRTGTGHAVLGSDPHQPFWLPSSWYEYAVHGPEDDAAGAGHPGVPGLWWGANGDLAWGITNNGTMTRDLYQETVDPANSNRYWEGDAWRPFAEEPIEIPVRDEATRQQTRRSTVRGPIMNDVLPSVNEVGDPPLSLRWVGHEHLDDVRAAVAIGRARSGEAFREALRDWAVAVFNFVYAERSGQVGYQCAGRIPVRGRAVRGYRDAKNRDDAWQGYVPFEAMPRQTNPERGVVSSANNRVVADNYPYPFYGTFAPGYRAMRIREQIEAAAPFDRHQVEALQSDVVALRARTLAARIAHRLDGRDDPDLALVVQALADWDGGYRLDAVQPAIYETFMARWQERVVREQLPDRFVPLLKGQTAVAARLLTKDDLGWFPNDAVCQAEIAAMAKLAIAQLRHQHGDDPSAWAWGRLHLAHLRHPLSNDANTELIDIGPLPAAGTGDTVCNTGLGKPPAFAADSGVEYRLVVDFAAPDRFLAVQNAGNSGQPGSPHYADQFEPWISGEYHTVHLTRTGVESDLESTTTLRPDGKA